MMEIRVQRDFDRSYLVMSPGEELSMEAYPVRMLLSNEIKTLLPCKLQSVNGTKEFLYDVTGEQSLADYYGEKKIDAEELRVLLSDFIKAVSEIQSYLLDADALVAKAEYMYVDRENGLRMCYLPEHKENIGSQFRSFLEYLLPLIDHSDSQAVVLGYGIYRESMKENFSLMDIKEYLYRESRQETQEKQQPEESQREALRQQAMEEFFDGGEPSDEEDKIPWGTVVISAIWTVVLLGIVVLKVMGYLTFLTFPMMLGIVMAVLGILILNTCLARKQKKGDGRMPEKWLQQDMATASIQWPGKKVVEPGQVQKFYEEENLHRDEPEVAGEKSVFSVDDTQPLPRLCGRSSGKLISREPQRYADIELRGDLTTIGKLKEAVDVVIPIPTISRIHGKIRRVDQEYYLVDLNSSNGTYLNGEEVPTQENRRIMPGDEITFADATYVFQM